MTHDRDIAITLTLEACPSYARMALFPGISRLQVRYDPADANDWDAVFLMDEERLVLPGETVQAYLSFICPTAHRGRVTPGMALKFRIGHITVAHGQVLRLVDLGRAAQVCPS